MISQSKLAAYLAERIEEKWAWKINEPEARDDIASDFDSDTYIHSDVWFDPELMKADWEELLKAVGIVKKLEVEDWYIILDWVRFQLYVSNYDDLINFLLQLNF